MRLKEERDCVRQIRHAVMVLMVDDVCTLYDWASWNVTLHWGLMGMERALHWAEGLERRWCHFSASFHNQGRFLNNEMPKRRKYVKCRRMR